MKEEGKNNIKKIKNILSDIPNKGDNKDFDVLFLVDATGSMESYIISAKEETKNISKELRKLYPEMNFRYGYIFYRDPIDSPLDTHEIIDLTDNVNSFPEKIAEIRATGGGDSPEDWVGAYKLANEKISWRDGRKVIIHLADAGAHGKLFTLSDKYPEEEAKLIHELEKCAEKKINIFGFVIDEEAARSFNECAKIYRNKGGFFEVTDFMPPEMKNYMMNNIYPPMGMGAMPPMGMGGMPPMGMMNNMNAAPMMNKMHSAPMMNMNMNFQAMNNMQFNNNAIASITRTLNKK